MNRIAIIALLLLALTGCREEVISKPDKLLSEDQMVDIYYDMAVIEGIRASDYKSLTDRGIRMPSYLYKKYKIDSLQLAQNEKYYAANIELFAKVYDRVAQRVENNKEKADSLSVTAPAMPIQAIDVEVDSVRPEGKAQRLIKPASSGNDTRRR